MTKSRTFAVTVIVLVLAALVFAQDKKPAEIAMGKPTVEATPTAVPISTSDLIKLNGALALQKQALDRREKALGELYAAMSDLNKAATQMNEVGETLPKDAQPVREGDRIIGFTVLLKPQSGKP